MFKPNAYHYLGFGVSAIAFFTYNLLTSGIHKAAFCLVLQIVLTGLLALGLSFKSM